jgi:hypothetical protein
MIVGGLIGAAVAVGIQQLIGVDEPSVQKLNLEQDLSSAGTTNPLSDSSDQSNLDPIDAH